MSQTTASDSLDDGRITAEVSHTQNTNSKKWRTAFSVKISLPLTGTQVNRLMQENDAMIELARVLTDVRGIATDSHRILPAE